MEAGSDRGAFLRVEAQARRRVMAASSDRGSRSIGTSLRVRRLVAEGAIRKAAASLIERLACIHANEEGTSTKGR